MPKHVLAYYTIVYALMETLHEIHDPARSMYTIAVIVLAGVYPIRLQKLPCLDNRALQTSQNTNAGSTWCLQIIRVRFCPNFRKSHYVSLVLIVILL